MASQIREFGEDLNAKQGDGLTLTCPRESFLFWC